MNAIEKPKTAPARPPQRKARATPAPTPTPAPAAAPQERATMIAEAAYYRAERRGFAPGAELEDWLDAEVEIARLLSAR